MCTHEHAPSASSMANSWEGSPYGRDGLSAGLRRRKSHSGLPAGLFPKCFGSLTHPYTEAGEKKKKKITKNVTGLKARVWSCAKHP